MDDACWRVTTKDGRETLLSGGDRWDFRAEEVSKVEWWDEELEEWNESPVWECWFPRKEKP